MIIKDIMHKAPIVVNSSTNVRDVWEMLFKKHVNSVSVIDKNKKLIGIVTKDDLLTLLYPDNAEYMSDFQSFSNFDDVEKVVKDIGKKLIKSCMNRKVIFTRVDTHVMRALSRMIARRVNQLPVVDEDDKVVGIVTKGDIFYMLFTKRMATKAKKKKK
ncbi:HPP family protein [Patescibacteria group bacterium]